MIGSGLECSSIEVGAKLTYTPDQSQHLLPGSAVLTFSLSKDLAGISDHLLPLHRLLRENSPQTICAGICIQDEIKVKIREGQYRGRD